MWLPRGFSLRVRPRLSAEHEGPGSLPRTRCLSKCWALYTCRASCLPTTAHGGAVLCFVGHSVESRPGTG